MKKKDLKIVYVEWCDAISHDAGWTDQEEILRWAENDNWIVKEVGFIIKETKEYILLTSKIGDYADNEQIQYSQCMKIPKTWIIKRQEIQTLR